MRAILYLLLSFTLGFATKATDIGRAQLDRERWAIATVNPSAIHGIDQLLAVFERNKSRYEKVSRYGRKPIPAIVIFALHYREADCSFRCHASNGDPLDHPTRNVPRGRLPLPKRPVFLWEDTAIDAYYIVDQLGNVNWSDMGDALYAITAFNGCGYYTRGLPSAYTWSKTSIYKRGKFPADGRFDLHAVDEQDGVAAILLRYMQIHHLTHL